HPGTRERRALGRPERRAAAGLDGYRQGHVLQRAQGGDHPHGLLLSGPAAARGRCPAPARMRAAVAPAPAPNAAPARVDAPARSVRAGVLSGGIARQDAHRDRAPIRELPARFYRAAAPLAAEQPLAETESLVRSAGAAGAARA